MDIGIIGAGNIGGELARKFRKIGLTVRISNSRGPETLKEFAAVTGAIASTTEEVLKSSEIIIIAVLQATIPKLPKELFHQLSPHVIVIDSGNYFPLRDGAIPDIDDGLADSEWVAAQLGVPVVKVFNNVGAASLFEKAHPSGHAGRFALPVSGGNEHTRQAVMELVESIGFDALDAGPLSESWRQQPGTPAFCTDHHLSELPAVLHQAVRGEVRARLDVFISHLMKRDSSLTHEQSVYWCREEAQLPYSTVLEEHKKL